MIGADGFGMAEEDGRWLKIPQIGRVVIGADVEIGANTTIDRGAIDDTVIEDDVKLDNQIQIGHNCRIGAHTAIAGCVGIAGSTRIGRNCKIGGAAMITGTSRSATASMICGRGARSRARSPSPAIYTGAVSRASAREVAARRSRSCAGCPELAQRVRAAGAQGAGSGRGRSGADRGEGERMNAADDGAWTSTRSCGTCRTGTRSCWSTASPSLEAGKSIRGIKNVTMNEPFFQGHFPGLSR